MFSSGYPVLAVRMALGSASDPGERIRYERAWVCRNGGCARSFEDGHDVDDWLDAERELRGAATSSAA